MKLVHLAHEVGLALRIMWRGDQCAHGVAFVAANDKCARYVEIEFTEGGLDAEVETPADDATDDSEIVSAVIETVGGNGAWHLGTFVFL